MIFVTVGTHEQQFDRLVRTIDSLKGNGIIQDEVFIQTGYSEYVPMHCQYSKLINYDEMVSKTREARIVITHGGPGSIMLPLSLSKIPIVVPRQENFKEHVDNHQVLFCKRLEKENKVIAIYDINDLQENITNYNKISKDLYASEQSSNLKRFVSKLDIIAQNLVGKS